MTSFDKKQQASSVLKFYTIYFKTKKKKKKESIMAALCIAILSTQLQINSKPVDLGHHFSFWTSFLPNSTHTSNVLSFSARS